MAPFFSHAASSSSTMEAISTTRKRGHPSPSSRSGAFTRSRSQLFLHCSRSGFLRPDPQGTRSRYQATLPPSRRIRLWESVDDNNGGGGGGDDMVFLKDLKKKTKLRHEVLMKDLRARRVYSPRSSVAACSSLVVADMFAKVSGVDSDCSGGAIADLGFGAKWSLENSGSEKEGSKVVGESGNLEKAKDEVNSILSLVLNEYRSDKDSDIYVDNASESSDLGKTESQDEKRSEGISSEKIEDSKEELLQTIPPDTKICASTERKQVEDTPLAGNAGEGSCEKDSRRNGSVLKSKSALRPRFQERLFKAPGSVSFKRLFPYLKDIMRVDSATEQLGHCQKDEKAMDGNDSRLPLSYQSQEPSKLELMIDSCSMGGSIPPIISEGDAVVAPVNDLSHGNESELTSSPDSLELDMQFHSKGVTSECLFVPSIKEVGSAPCNDKQDSKQQDSKADYVITANHGSCTMQQFGVLDEGVNHVQNVSCEQHNSESPPKAQNVLGIDCNVSNLTFKHHSSKEKGSSVDYDEVKPSESLKNCKIVSGYFLEGQSVKNLDPNMPDAQDKEKTNHKICRSDDAVVLNNVSLLGEEPRPSPEKVILGKSDMEGHGAGSQKAGSVLKGIVYGARMPSKGKNDKHGNQVHEAGNNSEIKTRLVINRCSQMELLKQTASYSYKRLLPYLSNTMKDSSCAAENDYSPKVQKLLDQTSSYSKMQDAPTGCAPLKRCRGSPCESNNDSSSPILEVPEYKPSHDSCKVIQLQDEQVVSNGHCKLESSPGPRISDNNIDSPIISYSPMAITRDEETASVLPAPSVYSEVKGNSPFLTSLNEENPSETCGSCQSLSQATFLEQSRVSTTSFKRGILKRSPRGCRGLCTCLNCASFHLHAERAFEFSRNQFLDAEEVAHDLIKELFHLRKILERSTESVNGNSILDGSQVKEACRTALVAEQLAKDRFSQMNDDLNIHCRISNLQRPRVRFSDHVEQKGKCSVGMQ